MLALVMAGGSGTRFWPKSRESHPKQLLEIIGSGTMLQNTVNRLQPLIPPEKTFIVCKEIQQNEVIAQLPLVPRQNIIVEPIGKNTAPCIGLGSLFMKQKFGDEVMVVLPADHLISPNDKFQETLRNAENITRKNSILITIGIPPTYASTGYGYIQIDKNQTVADNQEAQSVKTFREKPDLETAQQFVEDGNFFWNSGIFVWKISTILEQFQEHLPQISSELLQIEEHLGKTTQQETINRIYHNIDGISIDYGIMEHAKNVAVLQANFEWNDLGSWQEVYKRLPKDDNQNAVCGGDHVLLDTSGCLIDAGKKTVTTVGLKDLVIVETDDALLICSRNRSQEVKELVGLLKQKKKLELL